MRGEKPAKGVLALTKVQNGLYNPEQDILFTELRMLGDYSNWETFILSENDRYL